MPARRAAIGATDFAGPLAVSIPMLHRMLQALGGAVVGTGKACRSRYALRRDLRGDLARSSAWGEFPKVGVLRERAGSAKRHVLVKFWSAGRSAAVRRWSDLLVCEHLALECVAALPGLGGARSRIVEHAGRTFLEVERFDRHGPFGHSRLTSLLTLNAALLRAGTSDWAVLAKRFRGIGLLDAEAVERVRHLWRFGRLIANCDMHTGSLSFAPQDGVTLAPAYDMLPMLLTPLPGGELPARSFEPAAESSLSCGSAR